MLANGQDPGGLVIRHKCDNPPCCNPAHLETGTRADNNRDMVERGRARYVQGEEVGGVRLAEGQVLEIVALRSEGLTLKDIAARFGVHYATVQHILLGKTWTHVTGLPRINRLPPVPHRKRDCRGSQNNLSKLTEKEVRAIHEMRREGKTNKEIAEHFSVRPHTIYKIVSGRSWTHLME
jgi:DNA-binding CsgD family transcriptional regulator